MHRGTVLGRRKQKARPQKQSRDALSTSLLPDLLRNSEVANMYRTPEFLARAATTSWSLLQLNCSSLMTSSKHFETTGGILVDQVQHTLQV